MKPVERVVRETKTFQYRIDRSPNADKPLVFSASRSEGYQGSERVEVTYKRSDSIIGTQEVSLFTHRLTRDETFMLRDLLDEVLNDWKR